MTPQAVTVEELVEHLADIADRHGDIPATINNYASGEVESSGRSIVETVIPAGEADSFQAYSYADQEDTPHTKAALIN